jgi:hypothetical protein
MLRHVDPVVWMYPDPVTCPAVSLGAIHDDVVFDHAGAADLQRDLRGLADLLDEHRHARKPRAAEALAEWRGVYAEQFDQDQGIAAGNAIQLAAALRLAANGLGELSDAAHREQRRREDARAWERQQNERNWAQRIGDNIHDFVFGDDDLPKPPPPEPPLRVIGDDVATRLR